MAGLTLAYALSPIDLVPDFIPVLGYLDDLILLPAMAAITIRLIPKPIMDECRKQSMGLWENGKPKKWYYALPFLLFWLLILWILLRSLLPKLF